jgi:hypothetical protein
MGRLAPKCTCLFLRDASFARFAVSRALRSISSVARGGHGLRLGTPLRRSSNSEQVVRGHACESGKLVPGSVQLGS